VIPSGYRLCEFSPDRKHRYTLWRDLSIFNGRFVQFIGLNPSTADETQDDPTIRRCKDFAVQWGYGALCMTNLFSYRATDPEDMKAANVPPRELLINRRWIRYVSRKASLVVCAWGVHGEFNNEASLLIEALRSENPLAPLYCLGLTKDGHPKHPLYLRADSKPILFA
jgi:hypothetical protein